MSLRDFSFGSLQSWRQVPNAPTGTHAEVTRALCAMVKAHTEGEKLPIPAPVLRAMIVELTVSLGFERSYPPPGLLELLCWATNTPTHFMSDPETYIAEGWRGGRALGAPEAHSRAFFLDLGYFEVHGQLTPLATLQGQLAETFGKKTPARATLRKWQGEYRRAIEEYGPRAK